MTFLSTFYPVKVRTIGRSSRRYSAASLERLADKGEHVAPEQNSDPDNDCRCGHDLGRQWRIIAGADMPRLIKQHVIQNIDSAENDEHHFPGERITFCVLSGRRNEKHHAGYEIQHESKHSKWE